MMYPFDPFFLTFSHIPLFFHLCVSTHGSSQPTWTVVNPVSSLYIL